MERRLSDSSESLAPYIGEGLDAADILPAGAAPAVNPGLLYQSTDLDQLLALIDGDTNAELNIGDRLIDTSALLPETRNQENTTNLGTNIHQNPSEESAPHSVQVAAIVPSQPKQQTKKKKNYDPNKARTERRCELKFLRKEAEDLELTLKQLQTIQRQKGGAGHDQLALRKKPRVGNIRPGVWEAICARQLQRRLQVERENVYLKKVYSSQVQVARHLQRLMNKRIPLEDVTNSKTIEAVKRVKVAFAYMEDVAAQIFQELQDSVESAYFEVDAMFEANCAAYTTLPTRKPLLHNEVHGLCMGLFDSNVMPFDIRATGEAWWRRWHNYKGQRTTENANNMICEKYGAKLRDITTNTTGTFYGQQVLSRHVEEDRIVIIWHARIEPLEVNNERITGIHFLEKTAVLIEPYNIEVETDSDHPRESSARISTCYIVEPIVLDPELWSDNETVTFTKFMLATSSAYISTINETMENLLMDNVSVRF
ncbi:hypothetical protein PHYBOEH_006627 [Phytophthora boehmeriae]|uniref:M96 mating-specific protein family n=1 Tax=Phytophthora boehmeriae TaxID=109152 RepID=A0A8T1WH49_9STRA|nr:hypothetical protein PHYBOEH_006627 [Phytophthora boehmeriae]